MSECPHDEECTLYRAPSLSRGGIGFCVCNGLNDYPFGGVDSEDDCND